MKGFKQCEKNHFYKESLDECPYCPKGMVDEVMVRYGKVWYGMVWYGMVCYLAKAVVVPVTWMAATRQR